MYFEGRDPPLVWHYTPLRTVPPQGSVEPIVTIAGETFLPSGIISFSSGAMPVGASLCAACSSALHSGG